MIKIIIPNNNILERIYILDIIVNEFLGLDFEMVAKDNCKDWIIELENKKVLTIKDTFFNKFPNDLEYLKLENIPSKIEELDIFAASFFMLTRWEEYVNKNRDEYNRFPATESLAYKQGFLDRPVVNEYIEKLKQMLLELDKDLKFKQQKKELIITHDVDVPLSYPNLFSGCRDIIGDMVKRKNFRLAFSKILTKYLVLTKQKKDPYDTFNELMDSSESLGIKSYFFFMANGETTYDNFYKSSDRFIQELIVKIKNRGHYIGIHPTYNAYNLFSQLKKEIKELENNLQSDIKFGREHYLRFEVPTTWQIWEDNGMDWDSSCGYADQIGFRCGTGDSFSVFNILTRKKLKLKERPLIVMDCTLFDYNHYSYNEAKEKIDIMIGRSNQFTILWHNSYIRHMGFYKNFIEGIVHIANTRASSMDMDTL